MKNSFAEMTFEELISKRDELKRKLHDIRTQIAVGQETNVIQKRTLRRQIARLNTRIYNHVEVSSE